MQCLGFLSGEVEVPFSSSANCSGQPVVNRSAKLLALNPWWSDPQQNVGKFVPSCDSPRTTSGKLKKVQTHRSPQISPEDVATVFRGGTLAQTVGCAWATRWVGIEKERKEDVHSNGAVDYGRFQNRGHNPPQVKRSKTKQVVFWDPVSASVLAHYTGGWAWFDSLSGT